MRFIQVIDPAKVVPMIEVTAGVKLVYEGKELMLPGTVLTVKGVRTYIVAPGPIFETMVTFEETGYSEYNIRFFSPGHSME